mmetsp:Transcript_41/g.141  ORF Transcript_41/g.141 Transcript_41/m.141 type:complete len:216 (-) Transcript_41:77-724(-)
MMYCPSCVNLTSLMLAMISEKKVLVFGSSASSKIFAYESQSAESRMSANRMDPRDDEYMKMLQWLGWKLAAVMTSVSSSMFSGLMSTMLNDSDELSRCHRFTRRSSAERYVSPSELTEMELTWYACALAYVRRGVAHTAVSRHVNTGTFSDLIVAGPPPNRPLGRFIEDTTFSFFSNTFHSLMVLSFVDNRKSASPTRRHHAIWLIFSSISRLFR